VFVVRCARLGGLVSLSQSSSPQDGGVSAEPILKHLPRSWVLHDPGLPDAHNPELIPILERVHRKNFGNNQDGKFLR